MNGSVSAEREGGGNKVCVCVSVGMSLYGCTHLVLCICACQPMQVCVCVCVSVTMWRLCSRTHCVQLSPGLLSVCMQDCVLLRFQASTAGSCNIFLHHFRILCDVGGCCN